MHISTFVSAAQAAIIGSFLLGLIIACGYLVYKVYDLAGRSEEVAEEEN